MKKVLLLGASGSIGTQSLDVIQENPNDFVLTGFSVGYRTDVIDKIVISNPSVKWIYVIDRKDLKRLKNKYPKIKFYCGKNGLVKITRHCDYEICVDALVGFAGLEPAIEALKKNRILCLANKEALVTGGTIINELLKTNKGKLYPIDSEHVALAKCLSKCNKDEVKSLYITASGGALRNTPLDDLYKVTRDDALKHPTWKMGEKITIDCATMMNKGFEIIEAYYLYGFTLDKIHVLMHDESLIHSAVELNDGSILVDYGKPDMHNPIKWAMYEGNVPFEILKIKDFKELKDCHFHDYDPRRYPLCELAKVCLKDGASKMIALNAANESAARMFLRREISYHEITKLVTNVVNNQTVIKNPSLREIKRIDKKSRRAVK